MSQTLDQRIDRLINTIPNAPAQVLNYQGRVAEQIRSTQFNPPRWKRESPIAIMLGFFWGGKEVLWTAGNSFHARNILFGDLASPYHTQEGISLNYVLRGQITKMLMGHTVTLHAGEGCIMDTNCIHCELVDPHDAIVLCIDIAPFFFQKEQYDLQHEIDRFIMESLTERNTTKRYMLFRSTEPLEPLTDIGEMLLTEQAEAEIGHELMLQGLVHRFFRRIAHYCDTEIIMSSGSYAHDIIFFEVDRYIRSHLATVSAAELEQVFHFNRNYYNQLIKSQTGETFTGYLKQIRLGEAKRMLLESDASVQTICTHLGYENRNFFYRLFRQETGQTPQAFRLTKRPEF